MTEAVSASASVLTSASASAAPPSRLWPVRAAAAVLIVSHFVFLAAHFELAISSPDANGYLAQTRLIANEGRTWFTQDCPLQYNGIHWLVTPSSAPGAAGERYFSRYPPGLPLFQAIGFKIAGPAGALILNPIMASLSLLALYLIAGLWCGEAWGLLAAAVMAANPIANQHALSHDAHAATAFFFLWGLYGLARWAGTDRVGKDHSPAWAFAAGLALGIVPTVRYPEALLVAGCALFVLLNLRRDRRTWLSVAAGVAGMAIPLGALLMRNHFAFGAFWRTGYSLTNEQTGFGLQYFLRNFVPYLQGIQSEGAGLIFGLGVAGIGGLCARRDTWRRGVLLAALIVPSTLLYMAYYWAPANRAAGFMRFLLPTFPVYALAAVWLLKAASETRPWFGRGAGWALLAVSALWGLPPSVEAMRRLKLIGEPLAKITRVLDERVPRGSVVIAHPQVLQHLDFIGKWKLADETILLGQGGMARLMAARTPADDETPSPMQREKMQERMRLYEGLREPRRTDQVADDIWKWAGKNGKVFWVGDERQMRVFEVNLLPIYNFAVVEKIDLPKRDLDGSTVKLAGRTGLTGPTGQAGLAGPGGGLRGFGGLAGLGGRAGPGGPTSPVGPGGLRGGGGMFGFDLLLNGEPMVLAEWTR